MKKFLIMVLAAVAVLAVVALPAGACPWWNDNYAYGSEENVALLFGSSSHEDFGIRFDKIDDNAFQNVSGITTVQMSAGNGNIEQANTIVAVIPELADADDLAASIAVAFCTHSGDDYRVRFDKIDDYAFQNACGITTVQMSSGNGNVLQSNVGVAVNPSALPW